MLKLYTFDELNKKAQFKAILALERKGKEASDEDIAKSLSACQHIFTQQVNIFFYE